MPNTRCPTSVATSWTTRSGVRLSAKGQKRSTSPIARSVAPSKSPPAFDVIAPPSKSATTARPSPMQNPSASRYTLLASGRPPAGTEVFVAEALSHVQDPDAPTLGEICGLRPARGRCRAIRRRPSPSANQSGLHHCAGKLPMVCTACSTRLITRNTDPFQSTDRRGLWNTMAMGAQASGVYLRNATGGRFQF